MSISNKLLLENEKLAVIGLEYVGLPIAVAFAKKIKVIGFDITCELKSLKEYYGELKRGRNILAARNPFSNCTPYQQRVLRDITELNGNDEWLKENIVNRVENEFLRQEKDNKRNIIINIVSIAIGVVGILIPIISYLHGKIHITFWFFMACLVIRLSPNEAFNQLKTIIKLIIDKYYYAFK